MKFSEMLAPMSEVEFARRVMAGETFFIEGSESKFEGLISLEEIEQRLNDGCNTAMPVHIIRDGQRIPLLDEPVLWSGKAARKREIGNLIANGHSFMMTNMSQMNARVSSLMDSIEGFFENAHADLHLYVSPGAGSTGYLAHRDRPQHKIYLQIIGSSTWWIYAHSASLPDDVGAVPIEQENDLLRQKMHFKLTPGDLLYMPPNVFHKVRSEAGPRVSFSIPIIFLDRSADTVRMDRTHIPLSDIMTRASGV